jgi:hypothetical protein
MATYTRRSDKEKAPDYQGFSSKRLKGLEPSTFCMANGPASGVKWQKALEIGP